MLGLYSVKGRRENIGGIIMEGYTKVLEEKSIPVPLFPP